MELSSSAGDEETWAADAAAFDDRAPCGLGDLIGNSQEGARSRHAYREPDARGSCVLTWQGLQYGEPLLS